MTRYRASVLASALAFVWLLPIDPAWSNAERVDRLVSTTLELEPNAKRGGELFRTHCASCHGADASGNPAELVPALAGQRRSYLIKQLADFAELERHATRMHVVLAREQVSEPQDWADLTAYLSAAQPAARPQTGDGEWLKLGEASYQQWCASCHGEDARGDDDGFVPSLRNQHYAYLVQQMRELASAHRANVENELVLFLDSLDTEEIKGLADYLSRLTGPTRDRARLRDDGFVEE
jgi:cytochrome c553